MLKKEILDLIATCIEDDDFCPPAMVEQMDKDVYRVYQSQDGVERYTIVCIRENVVWTSWYIVDCEPSFTALNKNAWTLPPNGKDIMIVETYSGDKQLDDMVEAEAKNHRIIFKDCA